MDMEHVIVAGARYGIDRVRVETAVHLLGLQDTALVLRARLPEHLCSNSRIESHQIQQRLQQRIEETRRKLRLTFQGCAWLDLRKLRGNRWFDTVMINRADRVGPLDILLLLDGPNYVTLLPRKLQEVIGTMSNVTGELKFNAGELKGLATALGIPIRALRGVVEDTLQHIDDAEYAWISFPPSLRDIGFSKPSDMPVAMIERMQYHSYYE